MTTGARGSPATWASCPTIMGPATPPPSPMKRHMPRNSPRPPLWRGSGARERATAPLWARGGCEQEDCEYGAEGHPGLRVLRCLECYCAGRGDANIRANGLKGLQKSQTILEPLTGILRRWMLSASNPGRQLPPGPAIRSRARWAPQVMLFCQNHLRLRGV